MMDFTHCEKMLKFWNPPPQHGRKEMELAASAGCELCSQCLNLEGWVMARTVFAQPMPMLLLGSMKSEDCRVKERD